MNRKKYIKRGIVDDTIENFDTRDLNGGDKTIREDIQSYKNERNLNANSAYPDLDPSLDLNPTSLDELDRMEQNMVINTNNAFANPFEPLFLPSVNSVQTKPQGDSINKDEIENMTMSEFASGIANSLMGLIEEFVNGNYQDLYSLLLKDKLRSVSVSLLLVIISIYFVFVG